MLAEKEKAPAQTGEEQSSPGAAPAQHWFINRPESDATSLTDLVIAENRKNDWLRAGDVVYVAEIRRHTLTDADLDTAARAVIGGAA
ncbi:hypothetical protein [Massilia haematophila]|uniref:Uncharacterized protein n=1 Tax=Massilia haematophila TaxID=457923 RepID=A0ABV7PDH5_9BURK